MKNQAFYFCRGLSWLGKPSFYLLYTGEKEMKEEDLALSSLYIGKKEKLLELKVKLITLEKVKKAFSGNT